jgi:signal recognition particle GTPase
MESMICPVCKTAKQRKDFKRMATLSQTRAWLRNALATQRMTYIGKECNDCHKQTRRKSKDLTPNELHRRLINEGVNPLVVEELIARRRARGAKKKSAVASRVMKAHWKSKKSNQEER